MSISTGTGTTTSPVRTPSRSSARHGVRETKPFYRTSEFLAYVVATALVLVVGYSGSDEMNTYRTWQLVTFLTMAYVISRGLSKAGSREGARSDDGSGVYPS